MQNKVSPLLANGISGLLAGGIAAAVITTLTVATLTVTTLTATTLSASSFTLGGGTAMDKIVRTTAVVNADAIPAQSGTSSAHTLTGAASGDHCGVSVTQGDLRSTTSSAFISCFISASDVATVLYRNSASSTFDAGASTLTIEARSY